MTITSPIALRVDVFGDHGGLIVNNASNNRALGIGPGVPTPEPATLTVPGIGLLGLGTVRRRKAT